MKIVTTILALTSLFCTTGVALADELLIDTIHNSPVNSAEGIPRPTRGMSMNQVQRVYGDPSVTHPWVGQPPITRWDYPEFSVFFEHRYVLTSVVHRQ
jgi:outer membrane protein assembly factor BamE (lipoprotein component of BamABCDE complex)